MLCLGVLMDPLTSTQPCLLCSGCTLVGECPAVLGSPLAPGLFPLHGAALLLLLPDTCNCRCGCALAASPACFLFAELGGQQVTGFSLAGTLQKSQLLDLGKLVDGWQKLLGFLPVPWLLF